MAMEVNQKSKETIIEPKQQEDNEQQREKEEQLWSWGTGTDGQLGTARLQDEHPLPQLLNPPSLSSAGPVSMLACGGAHVVALTSGTLCYTFSFPFSSPSLFLGRLRKTLVNKFFRRESADVGKG